MFSVVVLVMIGLIGVGGLLCIDDVFDFVLFVLLFRLVGVRFGIDCFGNKLSDGIDVLVVVLLMLMFVLEIVLFEFIVEK